MKNKITNEEFKRRSIRHGELLLKAVDELPQDAKEIFIGKEFVCAHSETGHHHLAVGNVTVFESNGVQFLRANSPSLLKHLKTFDRHETKTIFEGTYQIVLKQEYDYYAKALARVRD